LPNNFVLVIEMVCALPDRLSSTNILCFPCFLMYAYT
jgi:hypothetical protein